MQSVIAFNLKGPMAHFRKFYSNASSLSYLAPPRTVLCGIAAAILGLERDSYYDILSPANFRCAVRIIQMPRKRMQMVNYLMTKSTAGLNGSEGHAQVPIEILIGEPVYRIYFFHKEKIVMDNLKDRILNRRFVYPLYLGLTEFIAEVENPVFYENVDMADSGVDTVINMDLVIPGSIQFNHDLYCIKDRMPYSFRKGRIIDKTCDVLLEARGRRIELEIKAPIYKVGRDHVVFLEEGGLD